MPTGVYVRKPHQYRRLCKRGHDRNLENRSKHKNCKECGAMRYRKWSLDKSHATSIKLYQVKYRANNADRLRELKRNSMTKKRLQREIGAESIKEVSVELLTAQIELLKAKKELRNYGR